MIKDYMTLLASAELGPPPSVIENLNHPPADGSKWWQESAVFTYGDADKGFGGEIRFGMHANQSVSNLYTWHVIDGEMSDRRIVVDQPVNFEHILESNIAGASVRTTKPLSQYALALEHGDLMLEATWRNFHHPLTMGYNVGGATIAKGHYNAMGRLTGVGRYRGKEFNINAVGFSDHSWGERRTHLPASRSLFCVFDDDFYLMAIPICSGTTRNMVGYLYRDGLLGMLQTDCEMGYKFRDDWLTPAGCDARLVDEHGRVILLKGWTIGPSSSQSMGHGKYVTHCVAGFGCEGRRGSGILESSQFKGMPPSIRALDIDHESWWFDPDAG